jgi:serine/threonine-protein kinase RsbW
MNMTLESDLARIERVVEDTEAFLKNRIPDDDLRYRVVLLATEAVTNAIEHGNKFDMSKRVHFRLEVGEGKVELTVQDEGVGFDPANTDDPLDPDNLMRDGGRGLLFMESMADQIRFEDEGRRVCLTFHAP